MKKVFSFMEKIAQNQRINGIISVIFIAFAILSSISGVIYLVFGTGNPFLSFSNAAVGLSIALIWMILDKIRYYQNTLTEAEKYIKKLEEENQDYKQYTDVLLNDPEVKHIMEQRIRKG